MIDNKKAFFLAEETVKIVLAVIVILFLAGFLYGIYGTIRGNKDLKIAQENLNNLNEKIKDGKTNYFDILGPERGITTKGWILVSFPMQGSSSSIKPNHCPVDSKNCLCICGVKNFRFSVTAEGVARICDELGTCLSSDFKIIQDGKIDSIKKGVIDWGIYKVLDGIILFKEMPTRLDIHQDSKTITRK